jgi:hypothetical protein
MKLFTVSDLRRLIVVMEICSEGCFSRSALGTRSVDESEQIIFGTRCPLGHEGMHDAKSYSAAGDPCRWDVVRGTDSSRETWLYSG